jgi:hypothetical protein
MGVELKSSVRGQIDAFDPQRTRMFCWSSPLSRLLLIVYADVMPIEGGTDMTRRQFLGVVGGPQCGLVFGR